MADIEIRVTAPEEYRAASAVVSTALMHAPVNDEDWGKDTAIASWADSDSLSAWDGDRCIGHAGGFRFETLVPGGAWLRTSGVTRVGVLGTHRRRGVLRQLITRLLTDALDRGQVLASLRASETRIYQRYGFGLAGQCAEVTLTSSDAGPISGTAQGGALRILRHDEILTTIPGIYERSANRPGVITRPEWMWKRYYEKALELGGDAEFVVAHRSPDGVDDGFAHYSVKWKEQRHDPPRGAGEVYDLWATSPAVELTLWEYLCNVDLVDEWYSEERPVDDVVALAVADTRAYRQKWLFDEQWLRILDVDAALGSRSYADAEGTVTIAVADTLLPGNSGAWEISAAGAKRLDDAAQPDFAVDVRELAAAYLGGTAFSALAAAGRVDVHNRAALSIADALFAVPEAPYCCSGF